MILSHQRSASVLACWVFALSLLPLTLGAQTAALPMTPVLLDDGWERETPAAAGFDAPRLATLLATMMAPKENVHSVLVERHGRLVAEVYARGKDESPYIPFSYRRTFGPTVLHDTRSVGKSVVSLLIGIAQGQGRLGSLATPAVSFYPEFPELATAERKAITLAHLLTMSSGLEWDEGSGFPDDENRLVWKWSPYRTVLGRRIVAAPGTTFRYHSGGTAVLADILARATHTPFKEYARTQLFEPLGIRDWAWTSDLHGRTRVYDGLRLRPRDMVKLGRLVLNRGAWHRRQLVPAAWIEASLQPHIPTGFDTLQYGYQWWTGTLTWRERTLRWCAAFGHGNQRIFLVPDLDLCVVVTAGVYDVPDAARRVNAFCRDFAATVLP